MERAPEGRPAPGGGLRRALARAAAGAVRLTGLSALAPRVAPRHDSLLVLAYHSLLAPPFLRRIAGIEDFRRPFARQMAFVARHLAPIGEPELLAWLDEGRPLPANAVLVTFDDGYRDTFTEALPVLRRLGLPAIVFATADSIGTGRSIWPNRIYYWLGRTERAELAWPAAPVMALARLPLASERDRRQAAWLCVESLKALPAAARRELMAELAGHLGVDPDLDPHVELPMLDWPELRALAEAGVTCGAHGATHEILTRLADAELAAECAAARGTLEAGLGRQVAGLAYPNGGPGDFDQRTAAAAEAAGFRYAMTFTPGLARPGGDRWTLPRLGCTDPSLSLFAARAIGLLGRRG